LTVEENTEPVHFFPPQNELIPIILLGAHSSEKPETTAHRPHGPRDLLIHATTKDEQGEEIEHELHKTHEKKKQNGKNTPRRARYFQFWCIVK